MHVHTFRVNFDVVQCLTFILGESSIFNCQKHFAHFRKLYCPLWQAIILPVHTDIMAKKVS